MSMRNGWIWGLALAAATGVRAEPMRPLLTRENRLPEARQLEVGTAFEYREIENVYEEETRWTGEARLRYGLARDLTLSLAVPGVVRDPDFGDRESGLGDVRVGLMLRAWEDIFGFPYLIPYAEATLATGDAEKGLGEEKGSVELGIAIGTTVYDKLHYALDVSYRIRQNADNLASGRAALIYDLSKKTSVLIEGEYVEKQEGEPESRQLLLGGLTYKPTRQWQLGFYGGGYLKEYDDVVAAVRVTYLFRPFIF